MKSYERIVSVAFSPFEFEAMERSAEIRGVGVCVFVRAALMVFGEEDELWREFERDHLAAREHRVKRWCLKLSDEEKKDGKEEIVSRF